MAQEITIKDKVDHMVLPITFKHDPNNEMIPVVIEQKGGAVWLTPQMAKELYEHLGRAIGEETKDARKDRFARNSAGR